MKLSTEHKIAVGIWSAVLTCVVTIVIALALPPSTTRIVIVLILAAIALAAAYQLYRARRERLQWLAELQGEIRFAAPEGKEPFIFLAAGWPTESAKFQEADLLVLRRPMPLEAAEVDVAVPTPDESEQAHAQAHNLVSPGRQPDRSVVVDILGEGGDRLLTCAIFALGSAHVNEVLQDTGPDGKWKEFAGASAFPGNRWHAVALRRTPQGCQVEVHGHDGRVASYQSEVQWPEQVQIRFRVMTGTTQPRGWFSRPRLS